MLDQRAQVFDQMVLRVLCRTLGNARGWKSAVAEGNTAIRAAEGAHLRVPPSVVRREFVAEDHRVATARVLVVNLDAVQRYARHLGRLPHYVVMLSQTEGLSPTAAARLQCEGQSHPPEGTHLGKRVTTAIPRRRRRACRLPPLRGSIARDILA